MSTASSGWRLGPTITCQSRLTQENWRHGFTQFCGGRRGRTREGKTQSVDCARRYSTRYVVANRAYQKDRQVELTSAEFELLTQFLKAPGQVLAREDLVKNALGRELEPSDRSLDVHISNLRRKLGFAEDGAERIRAIRNVGYVYVVSSPSP